MKKGISLIVLVITIIVLIILTGVVITTMTGNNSILNKAQEATVESAIAQEKEIVLVAYNAAKMTRLIDYGDDLVTASEINAELSGQKATASGSDPIVVTFTESGRQYTISSKGTIALDGEEEISSPHNWVRTKNLANDLDYVNCKCEECVAEYGANGITYNIGDSVIYDYTAAGGTGRTSIVGNKSGVTQAKENGINWFADYPETQIIDVTEDDITWVVYGTKDANNDGRYETLLLTTLDPTEDTIRLYGIVGYNNWISESNRMARELYGRNARCITYDDVCNCLQYYPRYARWVDGDWCYNEFDTEVVTVGERFGNGEYLNDEDVYYPDASSSTGYSHDDTEGYSYFKSLIMDGYYFYQGIEGLDLNDTEKYLVFGTTQGWGGKGYFLSTLGKVEYYGKVMAFGPGWVDTNCSLRSWSELFYSKNAENDSWGLENNFRAVVELVGNFPEVD